MPRSRSSSIESRSCGRCLRGSTAPVLSRMRSASVDLPWSMCAMIEKLRMFRAGAVTEEMLRAPDAAHDEIADLASLVDPHRRDRHRVDREAAEDARAEAHDLHRDRAPEQPVEPVPDAVADARERGCREKHPEQGRQRPRPLDAAQVP